MLDCWKGDGRLTDKRPGRIRVVQRSWDANDFVSHPETGEPISREHEANPPLCSVHGTSLNDDGVCAVVIPTVTEDGQHRFLNCDALLSRGVSTPHWDYSSSESTGPALVAPPGSRWATFHDACGPPSDTPAAWDADGWTEEPAE